MDEAAATAVRERLGTGQAREAATLLEEAARAAPLDQRIAHDRLAVATLFGSPSEGMAALDDLAALAGRYSDSGPTDEAALEFARDLADLVPLVLARFGAEELAEHIPAVAAQTRYLLNFAGGLPQDAEISARRLDALDLLWTYDDPRLGVSRNVYRPRSPHTVQIEPTNRCNLKCTMCPRTTAMQRPLIDMTLEQYAELLAGWSGAAPKFKLRVHAFGPEPLDFAWPGFVKLFFLGEILMHEDFDGLVRATRNRGAAVMPMTNGALLVKRSIRRKIVESDIQQLGISLDGIDAASYEAVRTGASWPVVRDSILALCAELESAGRRSSIRLHVNSLVPDGPGMAERNRSFLGPVLEKVDSLVQSRVGAATHPATFIDTDGRPREVVHEGRPIRPDTPSCFETLTKLNVLSDGRMTPCCSDTDGVLELGRMSQTIDEVWNSPATLALHRAHFTHRLEEYSFCQACISADVDPVRGLVPRRPLEGARRIG